METVPLYSKLLRKSDIEGKLLILARSLGIQVPANYQEGHGINMHVHDDNGKAWTFPCSVHRNDAAIGHFLLVGWLDFVHERDLRPDDKIIVSKEVVETEAVVGTWLKIEVKRKIRLFGIDIWADVK